MLEKEALRQLERLIKGFANHHRLQIMDLLHGEPELSVDEIAERLGYGYENASDHIRKLAIAGLVMKRGDGKSVRHKLTDRGGVILTFCKKMQRDRG